MPKSRLPGRMYYAVATKSTQHGAPCVEDGVAGVAVKQKAPSATTALSTHRTIAISERFAIIAKGIVQIPAEAGFAKGDNLYINPTNNDVSETDDATTVPLGKIVEVAGDRGVPTGSVRVDLDFKRNV